MQTEIITIYCLCVESLAAIGYRDDRQATLTTAEVMTVALVAARFFKGCLESSRQFLVEHGYMRQMLSKSRLNRRLHSIPEGLWLGLFALLAESAKRLNPDQEYVVDSLPVRSATTFAFHAAGCIGMKHFAATSRASAAISMDCASMWWSPRKESRWSLP